MAIGMCAQLWACAWPQLRAWLHAHAHVHGYGYLYPPIYHENNPVIKPILLFVTTMVAMPGPNGMSIDMGVCIGSWMGSRPRACAWVHGEF